jgi:hypothetical protein
MLLRARQPGGVRRPNYRRWDGDRVTVLGMTTTPPTHALPDWVIPGTDVVEQNRDRVVRTRIARVTPGGLIRLENSATYRAAEHGQVHKTGEKGPWFGSTSPTRLLPLTAYLRRKSENIVAEAAERIGQMSELGRRLNIEPAAAIEQMQAIVDAARTQLAAVGKKAVAASAGTAGES